MLSKKIEFSFSNFFKKNSEEDNNNTLEKKRVLEEKYCFDTKVYGFAIGFFTSLAILALILSIGLILP